MKRVIMSTTIFATFCAMMILVETACAGPSENVTISESGNGNDTERVMYSYSEAVMGSDGNAVVTQLTIAKGGDGEYHYVRTDSNGTTTTGKWTEPLPATPVVNDTLLQATLTNMTTNITDHLASLSQSIGSRLQDYFRKVSPV